MTCEVLNSLSYPLLQETAERLAGFLRSLGADLVLDTKLAEDWSLLEQQREMLQRYRVRHNARYIKSAGWSVSSK